MLHKRIDETLKIVLVLLFTHNCVGTVCAGTAGTLKWEFNTGVGINGAAALGTDGTVYVGSNKLYALSSSGTKIWEYSEAAWSTVIPAIESAPTIGIDGTIYVSVRTGKMYAINPDGTLKWSFTTENEIVSSPAIAADGTIYVGSNDNKLFHIIHDAPAIGSRNRALNP